MDKKNNRSNFLHDTFSKWTGFSGTFWILNLAGWLLYLGLIYLNFFLFTEVFKYDVIRLLLITFWGFVLTVVLRYIYRQININTISITVIIIIASVASLLGANIWFWVSRTMYYGLLGRSFSWVSDLVPGAYQYIVFWDSVTLIGWSCLYFSIKFWIEWDKQKILTKESNRLAEKAKLQMLRYQLNPHFLFNALNAIRALILEDKESAKRMVTELSEFLRYSLISNNYLEVSLNDEIQAIKNFFAIEKRRYEDKLEIEYLIDPLAEDFPIISFIIHPLADNAIKFGMQTSKMPLKIRIRANIISNNLVVSVSNTGQWINNDKMTKEFEYIPGSGLHNVQKRLAMSYPNQHSLKILKSDEQIKVIFRIDKSLNLEHEETA